MSNMLDTIMEQKKKELACLLTEFEADPHHPLRSVRKATGPSFAQALRRNGELAIIAEIKRRSPSRGDLAAIAFPEEFARCYADGGAAAISVLTDRVAFGGSLEDLRTVRSAVEVPVLRKDFIIHPVQLLESIHAGAQAVLLIAAVLKDELESMLSACDELGLDALVEVHNREELELSLSSGARIVGVNQRNLKTFNMHPEVFSELAPFFPPHVIRVAESGLFTKEQCLMVMELGYHAGLVGEALVRAPKPDILLREMRVPQFKSGIPVNKLLIKICGMTHPDDAVEAAKLGADYVGMVFSPLYKRYVDPVLGKRIADAAREHGAIPVAVFVEEGPEEILSILKQTGIRVAQLHGDLSRLSYIEGSLAECIFTEPVDAEGHFDSKNLDRVGERCKIIFDNLAPGSGIPFPWSCFEAPKTKPWFLAGGLNPENVVEALRRLNPTGIDMSSGVADKTSENCRRKDKVLMEAFIRLARGIEL